MQMAQETRVVGILSLCLFYAFQQSLELSHRSSCYFQHRNSYSLQPADIQHILMRINHPRIQIFTPEKKAV